MAKQSTNLISQIKPSAGYVFIEPQEQAKQTASGIYLPDTAAADKPQQGIVIAVGDNEVTERGVKKMSPAKKGETVIYKKWGGNEVKFDNKEYLLVKFEDVLAVIS